MKRLATLALLLMAATAAAQQQPGAPLNLPQSFAGSYGELRHDHFHGGVDWRTGGKTGDPIHAIKDGYVSRLSVSTTGYGNAVYITHPDGTVSIYGHMLCFEPKYAEVVKAKQYEEESFAVNVYPEPDRFPVKKGDVIGKVGSTGSSAAPHLHLELRDSETGDHFNYIRRGYYSVKDDMAPSIRKVHFYGLLDYEPIPQSYRLSGNRVETRDGSIEVLLPHRSYVAVDAVDLQPGTTGKLAVVLYKVFLDGEPLFIFDLGDIPAESNHYIQSVIEYGETYRGSADMIRTWQNPINLLSDKITAVNDGLVVLDDYERHALRIECYDEFGNCAATSYNLRRDDSVSESAEADIAAEESSWSGSVASLLWFAPNVISQDDMTFAIPYGALYNSVKVRYAKVADKDSLSNIWSSVWSIGNPAVPIHSSGILKIRCDIPEQYREKAYIASYDGLGYAGGEWDEDGMKGRVGFGTYCVAVDTIAPVISFTEPQKKSIVSKTGEVVINVRDKHSGAASARVEVDGKWVLSQFKRGRITLTLDRDEIARGKHTMKVTAEDRCGNEKVASREFEW